MKTVIASLVLLGAIKASAAEPQRPTQSQSRVEVDELVPVHVVAEVSLPYLGPEADGLLVHVIESQDQMLKKLGERDSKRVLASLKRMSLDFDSTALFVAIAGRQVTGGRALFLMLTEYEKDGKRMMDVRPYSIVSRGGVEVPQHPTRKGSYIAVLIERNDDVKKIKLYPYSPLYELEATASGTGLVPKLVAPGASRAVIRRAEIDVPQPTKESDASPLPRTKVEFVPPPINTRVEFPK